jgi:hypothetical protein
MVAISMPSFIFGGETGLTPEELNRQRAVAAALMQGAQGTPRNLGEGLSAVGNALAYRMAMGKVNKGEKANAEYSDGVLKSLFGPKGGKDKPSIGTLGASEEIAATAPTGGQQIDMTGNQVFDDFMGTVKQGVKNPYALAAIAATGKAESGFSPENVNRTWSDPSESGQAGTAGGVMSWRGPRYEALAATGDLSPSGQAKYFLKEDPTLIKALNNAKSIEEAQSLMNNAWKFAGYDRPGGEAANRLSYASSFLPTFQGQGEAEVASLDPAAGMAEGAIVPGADPIAGASLAEEAAAFRQSPEYAAQRGMPTTGQPMTDEQFAGRFGEQAQPVDASGGMDPVAMALARRGGASTPAVDAIETQTQTNAIPQQLQGSQQLASAEGGMMPTLNGGQSATAEQLAQAQQIGQQMGQQQVAQAQSAGGQSAEGPSFEQLMQAAADPRLSDQARGVVNLMLKREMDRQQVIAEREAQNGDPLRKLQLEKAQLEIDQMRNPQLSASDRLAREKFEVDKANSGKTNDIKNYEYYVTREREAGREPLGPLDWETAQRKASASSTNVTVGGEPGDGNLRKKLDEKTGELWSTYQEQGTVSASNAQDFEVLDELLKTAPQGPVVGRLAELFPGVSSSGDAVQSIVKRIAPTLRAPGSGATSDIEYDGMLKSLPALRNNPAANAMINQIMKSKAALNIERAGVVAEYGRGGITAGEARARIGELDKRSIMTPDMKAALDGLSGDGEKQPSVPADGADPEIDELLKKYGGQ